MKIIQSNGLGVESAAIITEWIENPGSRDFDLADLIVMTMQTGDEHDDTIFLNETFILPLLRKHKIRFVELARAGSSTTDGIVVLQDTREPYKLHPAGAYKLSDELRAAGTLPQFAGEHRCSLKFKAWVGETWLGQEFANEPYRHVYGYNVEEQDRIKKSDEAIAERNEKAQAKYRIVFGFNSEEQDRIAKAAKYDVPERHAEYPLDVWGWTRAYCEAYLFAIYKVRWEKSACVYCPFNRQVSKQTERGLVRLVNHTEGTADALLLERMSLTLNPRGHLFQDLALIDIIERHNTDRRFLQLLSRFMEKLNQIDWALYRVRRIYSKKGKADRAVDRLMVSNRRETVEALLQIQGAHEIIRGIDYIYINRRGNDYPAYEEFYTAGPAFVDTKTRSGVGEDAMPGMEKFDARWSPSAPAEPVRDLFCGG